MEKPHPMQTTAHFSPTIKPEVGDADTALREAFATVYDLIAEKIPEGRYKSLALTSFEVAAMWAIKALHHGT